MNTHLATIGTLSDQIIAPSASGQATADLENQRDDAVQTLGGIGRQNHWLRRTATLLITTTSGTQLPTRAPTPSACKPATRCSARARTRRAVAFRHHAGRHRHHAALTGGPSGAELTLRDTTLPTYQGELDEFSQTLASRFDAQGLTLFTDPTGNVPAAGVHPRSPVTSASHPRSRSIRRSIATPSLVRDGTQNIAGSPTGASAFTPNLAGGPAGFTGMISRVLDFAFGSQVQSGVTQPRFSHDGAGTGWNAAHAATPRRRPWPITRPPVTARRGCSAAHATTESATERTASNHAYRPD